MLRLKFSVILFLVVLLVGCGENPLDGSKNSNPQVGIELPKEIIGSDGASMALIPSGEFQMGSDENESEKPIHTVYLDSFCMDKYEVTNAQYRKFVQATGHKEPVRYIYMDINVNSDDWVYWKPWSNKNYNGDNQPVTSVSWEDAKAYADWAGERLPTEAEWEKAARGGLVGKKYVWGDNWPPPEDSGNFGDEAAKREFSDNDEGIPGYDDGYAYPAPVGSFKPNGYGLYDMAGNVWEWCIDCYDPSYYNKSPKSNPVNDEFWAPAVMRGGSCWSSLSYIPSMRVAYRGSGGNPSDTKYDDVGFRCAMDATK